MKSIPKDIQGKLILCKAHNARDYEFKCNVMIVIHSEDRRLFLHFTNVNKIVL